MENKVFFSFKEIYLQKKCWLREINKTGWAAMWIKERNIWIIPFGFDIKTKVRITKLLWNHFTKSVFHFLSTNCKNGQNYNYLLRQGRTIRLCHFAENINSSIVYKICIQKNYVGSKQTSFIHNLLDALSGAHEKSYNLICSINLNARMLGSS